MVSFGKAVKVGCKIASLSSGGPDQQIAVMHCMLVEEEVCVCEICSLHAWNDCVLLPGPESTAVGDVRVLPHRTELSRKRGVLPSTNNGSYRVVLCCSRHQAWHDELPSICC